MRENNKQKESGSYLLAMPMIESGFLQACGFLNDPLMSDYEILKIVKSVVGLEKIYIRNSNISFPDRLDFGDTVRALQDKMERLTDHEREVIEKFVIPAMAGWIDISTNDHLNKDRDLVLITEALVSNVNHWLSLSAKNRQREF